MPKVDLQAVVIVDTTIRTDVQRGTTPEFAAAIQELEDEFEAAMLDFVDKWRNQVLGNPDFPGFAAKVTLRHVETKGTRD